MDCLNGYLSLIDTLLKGNGHGEWNFGPGPESFVTVGQVANRAASLWGAEAIVKQDTGTHMHEAKLLALDSSKSQDQLSWSNKLKYPESLEWTMSWEHEVYSGDNPKAVTQKQIDKFFSR